MTDELYFEATGAGPAIVLLHGFGATLFTWRFMTAPLAETHRVLRIDLLGFGRSPKPRDADYSIHAQSDRLIRFLEAHALRDVVLAGHSLGGAIALLSAVRLRGTGAIRSLVLLDAPAYRQPLPLFISALRTPVGPLLTAIVPPRLQVKAVLKLAYFTNSAVPEESVRVYAQALDTPGARHSLVQTARALIPPDIDALAARYPTVDVPALLVWGARDEIVDVSTGQRLARELPHATLVTIDRAGHLPQEEAAPDTIRAVRAFLGSR